MFDLAIAVLNSGGAEIQLSEVDTLIAEEAAADGGDAYAFVPERIKLPAGGTLAFTTTSGDVIRPPLRAVVAVSQMARAHWCQLKQVAG